MKYCINGDAYIIASTTITVEDILLAKKHNPNLLKLKDDKGNDVFAIDYKEGVPSVSKFGVTFSGKSRDDKGYASITAMLPSSVEDPKEYLADCVGVAVENLKKLEETLPAAVAKIRAERNSLKESITLA